MKIVVLMGGTSPEREVSLESGKNIASTLREAGHDVIPLDTVLPIDQLKEPVLITEEHIKNGDKNLIELLKTEEVKNADFIFNALHGGSGENGVVQAILDTFGYKYNGSDVEGCAIAMDKITTKRIFELLGIPTPRWLHYSRNNATEFNRICEEIAAKFAFPIVVKPARQGSTVGVSVVRGKQELTSAIKLAFKYDNEIVIEEFIEGRELTVGIVGNQALPVLEIVPKHGIYDYECKYKNGMSEYIVPADIDQEVASRIQKLSLTAFEALRCYGYGRFDLRLGRDGTPYFFELNSLPGMTSHSLVPKAANAAGLSFIKLLEKIIELGLMR
ncbi:MAG: D-alanine--D-alanine ligase [Candidatus Neomarinimicrobiota bacterium]|nr:MAG: D-alanine--D-alanine ligase [Candidatus Neomarinimicrobiota bacterium]